jgi:hypothetical protein
VRGGRRQSSGCHSYRGPKALKVGGTLDSVVSRVCGGRLVLCVGGWGGVVAESVKD